MKRTNYYLKLMGGALLFQSLALQSMASQFSTSEGIGKILARMEQKFNVKFGYDASISDQKINAAANVDHLKKDQIVQFIQTISNGNLEVKKIDDKLYVVSKKNITASKDENGRTINAQEEVRGKVVDQETGLPIAGVTVRVKGSSVASTTDQNGLFKLPSVTESAMLQISYLGYETVNIPVSQAGTIKLAKSSEALEEVVVTALGIKREQRALGYATQSVKGEDLTRVKGVDVGTTLTGRVSGVRVLNSTEFNKTPEIQVRGLTPILVIDGVAYENMDLRDVPVDNIQDMNVLKGATATALYGSKGEGGAIMITTKKGLADKGTEITVNTNNMFFSGYLALPEVQHSYSSGESGKFNNDDYVWGDKLDIGRTAEQWNPITKAYEVQELTSRGKNNFKNFLEPGFISNNTVSFTNQGEHGSIRTSINHIYNKGQYPNQKLNLTNISVTGTTKINDKLDLEARLGYNRSSSSTNFGSGYNDQGYIYNILVWTGPEYDLRDYKDYWLVKDQSQNWMYKGWYDNPYLIAHEKITPELINKMNAAVTLNYKINGWAKFMLRSGYDYYGKSRTQRNPIGIYGTRGGFSDFRDDLSVFGGFDSKGKYVKANDNGFSTTNDAILTGKKSFGDFGIDGLLGGSVFYSSDQTLVAGTMNGLSIPGFYSLRNSIGPVSSVEIRPRQMRNGIYGRLSLSWRNALFLEATGRNDWVSTLTKENRSYFYPSLSASAVVTDLLASKPMWLDMFKVRASWAVTKSVLDPYEVHSAFTVKGNVWNGMPTASYPNIIKDYSISPTQRDLTEFGFDFAILKNRIYGNYTRYYRLLHNQIVKAKISKTTGFEERLINTKEEEMTKGHEITLGTTAIKRVNFQWDATINLSQNLRYFHKLDPEYSKDALYVKQGLRADYIEYKDWERAPDGQLVLNSSGMPISAQYANQLVGYTAPKWFWGFSNQFRYKDFTFGFSLDGRIKGMSYSTMNARLWQTGSHPDSDTEFRYEEVVNGNKTFIAPGVKIVSGTVKYDKYGQITEDTRVFEKNDQVVSYEGYYKRAYSGRWNYWDETFIKLRELSLSYRVSDKFASKLKAKKASVGLTAQNLLLWTKEFRFSDPDTGSEDLNSPSMRYIGFNVNLTF